MSEEQMEPGMCHRASVPLLCQISSRITVSTSLAPPTQQLDVGSVVRCKAITGDRNGSKNIKKEAIVILFYGIITTHLCTADVKYLSIIYSVGYLMSNIIIQYI